MGALLVGAVSMWIFYRQTEFNIKQHQISLSRDLAKEFYADHLYRQLRTAIESCQPLYRQWGGGYTNDQINIYLGFFDDLGFYLKKDALTLDIIDHLFGAYVIEAFEYSEIRKYIAHLRSSMEQPDAFLEFEHLAILLEKDSKKQRQVEQARHACKG